MILYALICDDGHRFDSWFRDSAAFDDQSAAGRLACPVCLSSHVDKAVMAPALVGKGDGARANDTRTKDDGSKKDMALVDPASREIRALLRGVRDKVLAEGHDVGAEFAAEARRIHEGEVPHRQIYGQASVGEARDLLEDGILVLPLPVVPDELN